MPVKKPPTKRREGGKEKEVETTLKIAVKSEDVLRLTGALELLETIKKDYPDLFQQAEVVIRL